MTTYLLCALLGGGVLAAICVPLFRKEHTVESAVMEETEWDLLVRKKEIVLGNIQDLDFEYKCGKLSDADYKQVRGEMTSEAAQILEHIHKLESSLDLDALIRREVDARRRPASRAQRQAPSQGSQPASTAARRPCPSCKAANPASNKFCAECGARLNS